MISIEKREVRSCCSDKKRIIWKLSVALSQEQLPFFQAAGYTIIKAYLDAGQLYIENSSLIATGVFGLTELNIKCKNKKCQESIPQLEQTILLNF